MTPIIRVAAKARPPAGASRPLTKAAARDLERTLAAPIRLLLIGAIAHVALMGIRAAEASSRPKIVVDAAVFKADRLVVKGRLRQPPSGKVEIFDVEGHALGLATVKGKRFSLAAQRASLTTEPCAVVAATAGGQAVKSINRASPACKSLSIRKAEWSESRGLLKVAGKSKTLISAPLDLYDLDANLLASEAPLKPGKFAFNLERATLKTGIPCAIRVTNGILTAAAPVKKAPAGCAVLPLPTRCAIAEPASGSRLGAHRPVNFRATVETPDPAALPVKVEWDFAGGVMGHPSATLDASGDHQTTATFVRDNSTYRVRFAATDAKGRRCEAAIDVAVGTPPTGLPPKVPEQPAPPIGGELGGLPGDLVVLPFEDLTMQSETDALLKPNLLVTIFPYRTLNAQVYRKGRLPERLGSEQVELVYSASSNPSDPAGEHSINSTSQNWPVGASMLDAALQKSDMFEANLTAGAESVVTPSFVNSFRFIDEFSSGAPDEGFALDPVAPLQQKRGNFMPGIANPYLANVVQPFDAYNPAQTWFSARLLPTTDIDDAGRINPYPLFRVEAKLTGAGTSQAVTDTVLTSGRDLHCRECHEKGGIAADSAVQMKVRFFESSTHAFPHHAQPNTDQPNFFEAAGDRLDERERAAYVNIASIHDFYDGIGTLFHALGGNVHAHDGTPGPNQDSGCYICHSPWQELAKELTAGSGSFSQIARLTFSGEMESVPNRNTDREGGRTGVVGYDISSAIHTLHGELMYNADKSGIRRWPSGRFERWHPEDGPNPAPLFPVKDAQGNILPMEENCLKCHGGQREQHYRDRMFTAGVTCYQCHGDMLAVGGFYKQGQPSEDGRDRRIPWLDQPDCGGCHLGSGNLGRVGTPGFFGAGVMTTAFDESDPAAQPRLPAKGADGARFAVPPVVKSFQIRINEVEQSAAGLSAQFEREHNSLQTPLYRLAKDAHGNVSCAACHGAAHAIWPNRDPNANDNVTAMQLQGHTGHILECTVCHTADAFLKKEDLDGGAYMGVPAGVLGGPHNLHPVNDPNWWKEATGQISGKSGWHDDYAQQPGVAGEDQCAACHGNDHRGTRLSKTPVAREFVDENGKKVLVKAGAVIGCDLCHSIEKSCTRSPNSRCGTSEGYVAPTNRPPVFTSVPVTQVIKGELYHAQAAASDPDGDAVTVSLSYNPTPQDDPNAGASGMLRFDPATGNLTADWATKELLSSQVVWNYVLTASDGRGGTANQIVTVKMDCPSGLVLERTDCVKLRFTSRQPANGMDAGQTFTYPVKVLHADGLPVTFSLAEGAPDGMAIDANGVLTFTASGFSEESVVSTEVVATDPNGIEARQAVGFYVCVGAQHWNEVNGCVGPIAFTSTPPAGSSGYYGLDVGQTLIYHAAATHAQNLPITFSLSDAPATMSIDPITGHLEWTADDDAAAVGYFSVVISASDDAGGLTKQFFELIVCGPPQHWDKLQAGCVE